MPVYKYTNKKGTMWRVHINYTQDGEHKQICKRGFTSKREALQYEQTLSATLKAPGGAQNLSEALYAILGINAPISGQTPSEAVKTPVEAIRTFQDVFNEYWATTDTRELSEGTKETKANMYNQHILPYFKSYEFKAITPQIIQQWQNEMKQKTNKQGKPFSDTFLHSVQSQLNAVLNYGVRKTYIPFSPMVDLKNMGKKNAPQRGIWSVEEYERFAEVAKQRPKTFILFELYYWHGLRRGEGLGLRPMDIAYNEANGYTTITIHKSVDAKKRMGNTKTASSQRTIELTPTVAQELHEYMQHQYELQPYQRIFEDITVNHLYKDVEWAIKESGVSKIRIHDMRHSHASLLISAQKYSSTDVARDMGHASANTTLRTYAKMMPETRTNIADTLEAMRHKI